MRSIRQATCRQTAFALLMACLFLLLRGYSFNDGDQSEHLPQVYQLIQPELYPDDFFMQGYNSTFTVRYFYVQLVYALSFVAPVPWICFILNLFFLALTAYCWMRITSAFSGYIISDYLSPLLIYFVFFSFTVGGNHIQYNEFDCGNISQALGSAGMLLFLRSRWLASGLMLGLASLFQVLVGWQLFVILTAFALLYYRFFTRKKILLFIGSYLLIAAFILVPMMKKQFMDGMEYDKLLYAQILYYFRNPLHFIPSLFPWMDYVKYFLLLLVTVCLLLWQNLDGRRFIFAFILIHTAGLLVYIIGIEGLQVYDLAKFQWFKATIWVTALCCVVISITAGRLLAKTVSQRPFPSWMLRPVPVWVSLVLSAICLFVILNSASIGIDKIQGRYKAGNYEKSDLTLMHEWIDKNLPPGAIVLVAPDNESFSCEARRSMPVNFKAIIHEPFFMFPWYKRVGEIYHTSLDNLEGLTAKEKALQQYNTVPYTGTEYNIGYRLDDLGRCRFGDQLGREIHRSGNYILTELKQDAKTGMHGRAKNEEQAGNKLIQ